jgi:hypothetical protein
MVQLRFVSLFLPSLRGNIRPVRHCRSGEAAGAPTTISTTTTTIKVVDKQLSTHSQAPNNEGINSLHQTSCVVLNRIVLSLVVVYDRRINDIVREKDHQKQQATRQQE